MKSEKSFRVFFLKQHRKNSLKNIFFPSESVFLDFSFWPQGHRTWQNAHCALEGEYLDICFPFSAKGANTLLSFSNLYINNFHFCKIIISLHIPSLYGSRPHCVNRAELFTFSTPQKWIQVNLHVGHSLKKRGRRRYGSAISPWLC